MSDRTNMKLKQEQTMMNDMETAGFVHCKKIADTLQGTIWSAIHAISLMEVVIKVTNKALHSKSLIILNGVQCKVRENILMEREILKHLTKSSECPNSVTKYFGFFKSDTNYYLVMEFGGKSFFDFVVRVHQFISIGKIQMSEWHKLCKILFRQMVECIEFIHSNNIAHYDVSLENLLINDIKIVSNNDSEYIRFLHSDAQIKICDFGLSDMTSSSDHFQTNKHCGKRGYTSPEVTRRQNVFDAKKNDVFALGVCLFMMTVGVKPWNESISSDPSFAAIFSGHIKELLAVWKKLSYVNDDLMDLLGRIFQYEGKRVTVKDIKQHKWLQ